MKKHILIFLIACLLTGCAEESEIETTATETTAIETAPIETKASETTPTYPGGTPKIEDWEYELIAEGEVDREWLLNKTVLDYDESYEELGKEVFGDEYEPIRLPHEEIESEKLTYWEVLYDDEDLKYFFDGQEFNFGEIEIDYEKYAVLVTCGRGLAELQGWLDRDHGDHMVIATLEEEHKGDKVFLYKIPRKGEVAGWDIGFLLIDGQKTYMGWYWDVINYDRGQWTPPESIPEPFIFEFED